MMEDDAKTINTYETIIIYKEKEYAAQTKTYRALFQAYTGDKYKIKYNEIGVKKLAYDIKGNTHGYYETYIWKGTKENIIELERTLRIDDTVLKFLNVKHDDLDEDLEEMNPDTAVCEQITVDAMDVLLGRAKYTNK